MKRALKFGLISGGIILLYTYGAFAYFGDMSQLSFDQLNTIDALGYLRYIVLLIAIYIGIRIAVKTAVAITFGALFLAGIQVVVVIAIIVGLMEYGYIQFWNPGFYDQYGAIMLEHLRNSGVTQEIMSRAQDQITSLSWMKDPLMTGLFYFFETFLIGAVGALVIAFFFRPKSSGSSS